MPVVALVFKYTSLVGGRLAIQVFNFMKQWVIKRTQRFELVRYEQEPPTIIFHEMNDIFVLVTTKAVPDHVGECMAGLTVAVANRFQSIGVPDLNDIILHTAHCMGT